MSYSKVGFDGLTKKNYYHGKDIDGWITNRKGCIQFFEANDVAFASSELNIADAFTKVKTNPIMLGIIKSREIDYLIAQ